MDKIEKKCVELYRERLKAKVKDYRVRLGWDPTEGKDWAPVLLETLTELKAEHPYPLKIKYFERAHGHMVDGIGQKLGPVFGDIETGTSLSG